MDVYASDIINLDTAKYLQKYSDLTKVIKTSHDAQQHWLNYGRRLGRIFFDVSPNPPLVWKPTVGLAITIFYGPKTGAGRLNIFKTGIESLLRSPFPGPIYIVDDGSSNQDAIKWLQSLNSNRFQLHIKPQNEGMAKSKNLCIRLLKDYDIIFLADDDIIYRSADWWSPYVNAINKTGYHHWNLMGASVVKSLNARFLPRITHNYEYRQFDRVSGQLMVLTQRVVREVGYLKPFPAKYGWSHVNYTLRIIHHKLTPGFIDIIECDKFIECRNDQPCVSGEDMKRNAEINSKYYLDLTDKFDE